MPNSSPRTSHRWRNFCAVCVTVISVAVLHGSFDAVPAGEDVANRNATTPFLSFADSVAVPLPRDAGTEKQIDAATPSEDSVRESISRSENVLTSKDALEFCRLMLLDGARMMERINSYTVVFNKEERIDGDLQEPQTIEMKVQHSPHFAVYMKWKTGPRGQQLLYSDQYEDGNMVVKFGGIKRLLPGIKLSPTCAAARAESRYPCTQAGILGMVRQILKHRDKDLKLKSGVNCVRLPNRTINERECYVFLVTYDNKEISELYRKSLLCIDSDLHIPVMVRNFTWAVDAQYPTEEELDKATLIENYSFQNLNLQSELVAQDFSRENPRYRM